MFFFFYLHGQYLFYIALFAKILHTRGETKEGILCFHILQLCDLRASIYQLWSMHNMMLFRNRNHWISQQGIDYKQIDAQWHWSATTTVFLLQLNNSFFVIIIIVTCLSENRDNFLILEAVLALLACFIFPTSLNKLPFWDSRGVICCLALHVGISEPLYYWFHRLLLHSPHFFSNYHWLHHSSRVLHPHAGKLNSWRWRCV